MYYDTLPDTPEFARVSPNYDHYLDRFQVKDIIVLQDLSRNFNLPIVSSLTGEVIPNRYFPLTEKHLYGMVIRKEKEFIDVLFGDTIGRVYPAILKIVLFEKVTEENSECYVRQ